jgi:putative hydrolase of the HAD superfamily
VTARLDGRDIEAVLIDAGGVLVDPNWGIVSEMLGRQGIVASAMTMRDVEPYAKREIDEPGIMAIARSGQAPPERYIARILRHAGIAAGPAALAAAVEEIDAYHAQHGLWEVIPDGAPEALDALRAAGLKLALSSNTEPLYRSKLAELGLAQRFRFLTISDELGVSKPNPRFFEIALAGVGVTAERAVHVGDYYEFDVVGARAAGVAPVMIDVASLSADRDVTRIPSLAALPELLGIASPA